MYKLKTIGRNISTASFGALATLAPGVALAATNAGDFIVNPTDPTNSATFSGLVGQIITIILFVVGVAAILYLLFSGLQYVTAGGDEDKASNARKGIINAVIGIIIVLSVWFIFRATINVGTSLGSGSGNVSGSL